MWFFAIDRFTARCSAVVRGAALRETLSCLACLAAWSRKQNVCKPRIHITTTFNRSTVGILRPDRVQHCGDVHPDVNRQSAHKTESLAQVSGEIQHVVAGTFQCRTSGCFTVGLVGGVVRRQVEVETDQCSEAPPPSSSPSAGALLLSFRLPRADDSSTPAVRGCS